MPTRLLDRSLPTPTVRPSTGSGLAQSHTHAATLPVIAVVVLGFLAGAGNTSYMLYGLGLLAIGVLLSNLAPMPSIDPTELSLTVFLAIVVAVPLGQLPHNRTSSIIFVLVLLAISLSALARAPQQPPHGRVLVALLFLLLVPASLYGPDSGAIKRLVLIGAGAVPAFFLGAQLERARLRTISLVLLALALAESVLAIAEPFAFPGHLWVSAGIAADGSTKALRNPLHSAFERSQGTLGHPLAMGILLVIALALLIRVLNDLNIWTRWGSGALLLVGLLFSGDRSCLLAALLVVIAGTRLTAVRAWVWLGSCLSVILLAVAANAVGSSLLTNFAKSGSYGHRASAYSLIWRLFNTQPMLAAFGGNGFGSTQRLFDKGLLQTDGFNVVDNQFVLIQAQGGVLCLLVLVALMLMAIHFARPQLRPVVLFAVGVSVLFDWLSWTSDSALVFLLLGAGLASLQPSRVADRFLSGTPSTLRPPARPASLQG